MVVSSQFTQSLFGLGKPASNLGVTPLNVPAGGGVQGGGVQGGGVQGGGVGGGGSKGYIPPMPSVGGVHAALAASVKLLGGVNPDNPNQYILPVNTATEGIFAVPSRLLWGVPASQIVPTWSVDSQGHPQGFTSVAGTYDPVSGYQSSSVQGGGAGGGGNGGGGHTDIIYSPDSIKNYAYYEGSPHVSGENQTVYMPGSYAGVEQHVAGESYSQTDYGAGAIQSPRTYQAQAAFDDSAFSAFTSGDSGPGYYSDEYGNISYG